MKTVLTSFFALAFALATLFGCKNDADPLDDVTVIKTKKVSFSVTPRSSGSGRTSDAFDPKSILITIVDKDDHEVVIRKELPLLKVNDEFLSVPLTLEVSGVTAFKVREFIVTDQNNDITHLTPREGSAKAHLVHDPLDVEFSLADEEENWLLLEVVAVDETSTPEDFGYITFSLAVAETIKVKFTGYLTNGGGGQLGDMQLQITGNEVGGGEWVYETSIDGRTQRELRKCINYIVRATRYGYHQWEQTVTLDNNSLLEIYLERGNTLPTISSIQPEWGTPGQIIKVRGTNLGNGMSDAIHINFGPYIAIPLNWISSTEVDVVFHPLPAGFPGPRYGLFPVIGTVNGEVIPWTISFNVLQPFPDPSAG